MILFGKAGANGLARGETAETFGRLSLETLEYIAANARHEARRKLALAEIARRKAESVR